MTAVFRHLTHESCNHLSGSVENLHEVQPVGRGSQEKQKAFVSEMMGNMKSELIALLPRLRRFARSMTRSVPEADDLVQETCLKALSQPEKWDQSQPLDRWVFRIMRNLWISEIRKRTVRIGQGQVPAEEANELTSRDTGEQSLMAAQLRSQINALPDDLSSLLLAVSVEGYSYAEAAALFDIPIGTVMSRIHRARKTLATQISATAGETE